ncbi:Hypothetical protein PENO1_033580 [Penicillium occitanis (nom. inval.)]|nr:Hypothetical protein PENO1_033580 [Penicillium occitanis (nom. inval.)]PCH10424.1 hypothetical protein PENOC_000920 [Penicillium occitanis (nom. inval.)]
MESAESSPEKQNTQKSHAELLQAFQSFKPAGRASSKTRQPPSTSRTQRSSTPATNAGQAIRAGMTAFELDSPNTAPSTQETTTRKRARRTPYTEQTEENESSDNNTPPSQTVKRPRQTPAKTSDKQASTIPKHVVEVQIHNDLARMEQVAQRSLQQIDSTTQGEKRRASMTPEVAASSIEGVQGQTLQHQNSDSLFVPQTVQSSKALATQLLKENQKFAEQLSQKNGTFLRSMPSTAVSYLEAKLARVTDEMTRLHKEKVDAIRLEYVAELQRDMDERQKVIDMLLQKPDV